MRNYFVRGGVLEVCCGICVLPAPMDTKHDQICMTLISDFQNVIGWIAVTYDCFGFTPQSASNSGCAAP